MLGYALLASGGFKFYCTMNHVVVAGIAAPTIVLPGIAVAWTSNSCSSLRGKKY